MELTFTLSTSGAWSVKKKAAPAAAMTIITTAIIAAIVLARIATQ
jgi:hypothetical protein